MNAAPVYDLILQGGHVICPASGIDGVMDVAIAGGKIAQVGKDILPSAARQVTDVVGRLRAAQPAWSDRRVHDTVLGYGNPPPRHLPALLGLA